ncbi:MAG: M6 family metalloprotease domain-containing protein, partial [Vicinamibacterales bacterium]
MPFRRAVLALAMIFCEAVALADIAPRQGDRLPAGFYQRRLKDPTAFTFKRAYINLARQIRQTRVKMMSADPDPLEVVKADAQIAVQGERSIPVLTVLFKNTPAQPYPAADLQARLFGPTGDTMTSFYRDNSYGLLTVTGRVENWVKLSQNDTFYEGADIGGEKCNGVCQNAKLGDMLKDALDAADKTIDFGQFDNDGPDNKPNSGDDDGFADFVAFVHPEMGGECSSPTNRNLWSHRWTYTGWKGAEYPTQDKTVGGARVKVDDYVIMPAFNCDGTSMIHIGVFAHEFGHAFGLPDLYDTDAQNGVSQGIGVWCLMASGSWGGDNQSPELPTHMSAWAKSFLGWVQPQPVEADRKGAKLEAAHDKRTNALKIAISANQYYLLEYRPKKGFDAKLPSAGLLVWRINDTVVNAGLANNRVNADAANKGVD